MSEEHKNCKYRFKGKSCKDCPLNCKFKRLEQQTEAYQLLDNEAKEIIAELKYKLKRLQEENYELKTNIELMQTALYAIRFSCKLKLEEGQKALHIEPIMRIIDEVLKNE